ncbi:MAG: hypothetical protein IJ193_08010 [Bacilli bacterium]|nr:hypothetical protein [Bacilli bacterium]
MVSNFIGIIILLSRGYLAYPITSGINCLHGAGSNTAVHWYTATSYFYV